MPKKDPLAPIERRYGFHVPDLYRSLLSGGHFHAKKGADLLTLTDLEWLTPQAIAEYQFLDWQTPHKTWFVPFAISGRHDEWGWRLDWAGKGEPPVVFCEWGPEGFGYAPDFRGFLYRRLLEEFSGTWLLENAEDERGQQTLTRSLEIILPHLPNPWAARLKKLAKAPWSKELDGTICVFPRSECDEIVAKHLAFPHLEEKFWQEEPPAKLASVKKKKSKSAKKKQSKKKPAKAPDPAHESLASVPTGPDKSGFAGRAAGEMREDNGLQLKLCWCPPGTFQMGSPADEPDREDDEGPVSVTLTHGFWLGKYPVTQREFEQLTGARRGTFTSVGYEAAAVAGLDTDRFPVERLTWEEATAFCRQFTKQEHAAGRLPANWEYRLPTEAQWEYACRAGTTTATAFGNKLSSRQANFDGTAPYHRAAKGPHIARPTPVGSYPANAWGLHDMHGNVLELCRDAKPPQLPGGTDPEVVPSKQDLSRVVRGGSWRSEGSSCRSAFRYGMMCTIFDDALGFRIACVRIS